MTTPASVKPGRNRLEDLLIVMERLVGLYEHLRVALNEKLVHMRRSDHAAIQSSVKNEERLVVTINQQEGLRKQVMERVGRTFGLSASAAREMNARELSKRVAEPYRSRIDAVADRLRHIVEEVTTLNGFIARVSAEVLNHLREVFSAMIVTTQPPRGYSRTGHTVDVQPKELFEAVG